MNNFHISIRLERNVSTCFKLVLFFQLHGQHLKKRYHTTYFQSSGKPRNQFWIQRPETSTVIFSSTCDFLLADFATIYMSIFSKKPCFRKREGKPPWSARQSCSQPAACNPRVSCSLCTSPERSALSPEQPEDANKSFKTF